MKAETREGLLPGCQARLATFLASSRVRITLLVAIVLLYTGWIGYQWKRDYLVDFNLYYLATYGFDHGIDIYYMGREYNTTNWPLWAGLAVDVGIANFAPPYLYPPLTAQLVTQAIAEGSGLRRFYCCPDAYGSTDAGDKCAGTLLCQFLCHRSGGDSI